MLLRKWMDDERNREVLREDHWNLSKSKRISIKSLSPWFMTSRKIVKQDRRCPAGSDRQLGLHLPIIWACLRAAEFPVCASAASPKWECLYSTKLQPGDCSTLLEGQEATGLEGKKKPRWFYSYQRDIAITLVPCKVEPLRYLQHRGSGS